jgi:hypothetical protein
MPPLKEEIVELMPQRSGSPDREVTIVFEDDTP